VELAMPHENATTMTYLVEHYQRGLDRKGLDSLAARVRAAAEDLRRRGAHMHDMRSTMLPGDETLLCLFHAESKRLVRAVYARAGLAFDRITEAITVEDGPIWPTPTHRRESCEQAGVPQRVDATVTQALASGRSCRVPGTGAAGHRRWPGECRHARLRVPGALLAISAIPAPGQLGAITLDQRGNNDGYVCLMPYPNPDHTRAPPTTASTACRLAEWLLLPNAAPRSVGHPGAATTFNPNLRRHR
jgi:hypothetical protein